MTIAIGLGLTGCHRGWHSPEEKAAKIKEHVADHFELNSQQSGYVDGMVDEFMALHQEFRSQKKADLKLLLDRLNTGKNIDALELHNMYAKRRDAVDAKSKRLATNVASLMNSLSSEQKKEIKEMIQDKIEDMN